MKSRIPALIFLYARRLPSAFASFPSCLLWKNTFLLVAPSANPVFFPSSSFFFFFFFSTRLQPRVGHNKRGERERNVNDLQSDVEPPRVVTSGAAGAQVSPEVVLRANGNGKSEHGLRRGPEGGNVPERREEEERLLGINFHRTRHDCVINNVNNVPS